LTAGQNVALALDLKGVGARLARERAASLLEQVGLRDKLDAYPADLSGGQKQRVAIARALAGDPKILLMDEPFGALDAQTRRTMQDEVTKIWAATGKTIVFVTHAIEESLLLADRVVVMSSRPGRIKAVLGVPLDRPRSDVSSDFVALKAQIQELLKMEEP